MVPTGDKKLVANRRWAGLCPGSFASQPLRGGSPSEGRATGVERGLEGARDKGGREIIWFSQHKGHSVSYSLPLAVLHT